MAMIAKAYHAFDYGYTQTDKNHTRYAVGYRDYVKTDEYKGGTFNSISYADGKITRDKVNLVTKANG
jgi:hypothetical protein